MKKNLTALFFLFCHSTYSQCVNCNSLKEALKKPEIVKSLEINAEAHKIYFDSFPKEVFVLTNLEKLSLSDENLYIIPPEIGKLKKLKQISFPHCRLERLPDEIFTLKNLTVINLLTNNFPHDYLKELKAKFQKYLPKTLVLISKEYLDISP